MSKHQETSASAVLANRGSAAGRVLSTVKKDVQDAVDLYFRPVKVLAREFTKASEINPPENHSPAAKK